MFGYIHVDSQTALKALCSANTTLVAETMTAVKELSLFKSVRQILALVTLTWHVRH